MDFFPLFNRDMHYCNNKFQSTPGLTGATWVWIRSFKLFAEYVSKHHSKIKWTAGGIWLVMIKVYKGWGLWPVLSLYADLTDL